MKKIQRLSRAQRLWRHGGLRELVLTVALLGLALSIVMLCNGCDDDDVFGDAERTRPPADLERGERHLAPRRDAPRRGERPTDDEDSDEDGTE